MTDSARWHMCRRLKGNSMEFYLTMMYITLDQETAVKDLFQCKGWSYCKIDMSFLTDKLGPCVLNSEAVCKKTFLEQETTMMTVLGEDQNNVKSNDDDIGEDHKSSSGHVEKEMSDEALRDSDTNVQPERKKSYLCPTCGKKFQKALCLDGHMKVHEMKTAGTKRQFVCAAENCGKSFSRKSHWQFHMNIHEKKKPFVCEYCGNQYSSQYSHKRHILVRHTGDGGRCSLCGKTILDRKALLAHKAICHTKSSHRCELCGAIFKWKARLRRHLKRHNENNTSDNRFDRGYIDYNSPAVSNCGQTSKLTYQCEHCMAKFEFQSSYDNHVKNKTCEGPKDCDQTSSAKTVTSYFCRDCNKSFKWKQSFYKHRKKQHCSNSIDENCDEENKKQEEGNRQEIIVYYIPGSDKTEHDDREVNCSDTRSVKMTLK